MDVVVKLEDIEVKELMVKSEMEVAEEKKDEVLGEKV